ncbi:hypothetical protein [Frigoribacterium sp. UYMn621]|uniref:phage tail tube protein n=1 Tax=Frigoribacterium sp. UYMn621 TaxID=3156343 RepID=UPI0033941F36
MSATKTLRGNVTIWAVRPEAFADWSVPISLAAWSTALASGLITDISCAVEDGYKLNLTGSAVDNSQSVCDITVVETPLYYQYEALLELFRNRPGDVDMPIYDIALSLFDAPDVPYFLVKRIDKAQGSALAVGDIVSAFGVYTDLAQDVVADGAMLKFGAHFKTTGGVNTNKTVTA